MMVLCLDFGNTQLKYALLENDLLEETGLLKEADISCIHPICQKYQIDAIMLSSVIDISTDLIHALQKIAPFHQLSVHSLTDVNYQEYDKTSVGVDRLAIADGAQALYPGKNHLSICLGTCITYNWVENGYFKGGAISPGLMMRAKSMYDYTAHLPIISPKKDFPLLGQSTFSNLLAGTMSGILLEIQGYIGELRKKDPGIIILLCGGDAPYFISKLSSWEVRLESDLIWKGLVSLARLN